MELTEEKIETPTAEGDDRVAEMTRELCEAVVARMEAEGLREKVESFMADDEARQAYRDLHVFGDELHQKQHTGEKVDDADIDRFNELRDRMLENTVAADFSAAREKLGSLHGEIMNMVTQTFELGRVPTEEELGAGGCCNDEGCGCRH